MTTIAPGLSAVEQVPLNLKNKISVSHVAGGGSTPVSVTLDVAYGRLDLVAGNSHVDSISGMAPAR